MKSSLIAMAVAIGGMLGALSSPASAGTIIDIYGTYTDSVTKVTSGDNAPTINLSGGLQNTKYFNVDNLTKNGAAGYAVGDTNGLLFTVDPASCMTSSCNKFGTETATINVDFTFYNSSGTVLGTLDDSALATFIYKSNGADSDNLCWQNSAVSGSGVVSEKLVGTCGAPGSGLQTAYEQIKIDLAGTYYNVNLYDWNDWDEQPKISFQMVPEPASLALFAASLLGLGLIIARQRRTKAQPI